MKWKRFHGSSVDRTSRWWVSRYLPPAFVDFVRRALPSGLKMRLRERLGADVHRIPERVVTVRDGRRFAVRPHRSYWDIYYKGGHEAEISEIVSMLLSGGDVVVDVGANVGWYTTLAATLIGPEGHVHAFEPLPFIHDDLARNVRLNALEGRVTLNNSALADFEGVATIHFDPLTPGLASLGRQYGEESIDVPVTTLDEYCIENAIEQIAFLKCDVEGAEEKVLTGGERLLSLPDAPIVACEMNVQAARKLEADPLEVWRLLRDLGYDTFFRIEETRSLRLVNDAKSIARADMLFASKGSEPLDRLRRKGVSIR